MKRRLEKQTQRDCRREVAAWRRMAIEHPAVPRELLPLEQLALEALADYMVANSLHGIRTFVSSTVEETS